MYTLSGNFFGVQDKIFGHHYVLVMSADLQYFSNITRIKLLILDAVLRLM